MFQVQSYRTDNGVKTVLVGPDRQRLMSVLFITESGLKLKDLPISERRYMTPPIQHGKTRTIKTTVRSLRKYGARFGLSKTVRAFLNQAYEGGI